MTRFFRDVLVIATGIALAPFVFIVFLSIFTLLFGWGFSELLSLGGL